MFDIDKFKLFSEELKKETHNFYQWSNGKMRISDSNLEFIVDKAEKSCGRDSLWESGSHKPGKDQYVFDIPVSCKSAKIKNGIFKISSYRLTTCETTEEFVNEILKRDESFQKYLVCLTEELEDKHIVTWAFIDKSRTNLLNQQWEIKHKKNGKESCLQTPDEKFAIFFSMSNQLWIKLNYSDLDVLCEYEYFFNKEINVTE